MSDLPFFGPMTLTGFTHPWFFLVLLLVAAFVVLSVLAQYLRAKQVLPFAYTEFGRAAVRERA